MRSRQPIARPATQAPQDLNISKVLSTPSTPTKMRKTRMTTVTLLLALLILLLLTNESRPVDSLKDNSDRAKNGPKIVIIPREPTFFVETQSPNEQVLICQTAGDQPQMFSQVRWTGPNKFDNWEELSKRHIVSEEFPNSNIWSLQFRNPKDEDSGIYYCRGTYQSSDVYNASIEVKVTNPIKLENCPDRQFLIQGSSNSKITCRITADDPKVQFLKDGAPVDAYSNRYKWDNDDGLVINGEVNKSDAGNFWVTVRSELTGKRKQQNINVEVHSKPEFEPFNGPDTETDFYGVEGEQTQLECKVSGNPQPLVYWFDPKLRNLTSVGGYIVNPERGTLQINRVNKVDDHGMFRCVAYNTVGTTSQNVSMAVYTRPNIVSFINQTVDEGSDVTFECRSTGDPKPDFSIRRQGIDQQPYRRHDGFVKDMTTDLEGGGSNVYVHRMTITATRSLFGLHYCNVTNRAGTAERFNQLTVNYKPDLSQTPPEQYVKLGKSISVTCHIKAFPAPTVTWRIDNVQIRDVEASMKTSPDKQVHIITMKPPSSQQAAFSRFVCEASNQMGRAEQTIIPRYTTIPGSVTATLIDRSPTTVKLLLSVSNDGGDRIKAFKYRAEGKTLDFHNPLYGYRVDRQNESIIDASLNPQATYTIRNLLPYYSYRLSIRAVNDMGEGDITEIPVETLKPTRPEPPVIIKPGTALQQHSTLGVPSEYQNGYLLKWSPPDLDNGGPILKYIIRYNKIDSDSLDIRTDVGQQRIVEQMSERPVHARLGPLDPNQRYKIQIQARNQYGDSEPAYIVVYTTNDRPPMPEFEAQTFAWLVEPPSRTLMIVLGTAVILLILIELIFCYCFQMGLTLMIRSWCCPAKPNSVISDKTYP